MHVARMRCAAIAVAAAFQFSAQADPQLQLLNNFNNSNGDPRGGNAEILAYSADAHTVAATLASAVDGYGVQILTLSGSGVLSERGLVTFNSAFGSVAEMGGASSTAIDPLNRGFGVVALIPSANGTIPGKLGFYDYRAGSLGGLHVLDVGYHPDSVKFSSDGNWLFVANEGEFTPGGALDAPGSVSLVDLSGVTRAADVAALTAAQVTTIDFSAPNLGAGVSLGGIRINDFSADAAANRHLHIEPEFLSQQGDRLFVTLQENNAIAELDLTTRQWSAIRDLGTITQLIDASDRDGPGGSTAARIDDQVQGVPMPDTLATFKVGGTTYGVTANEGDFRVDDGDRARFRDAADKDGLDGDDIAPGLDSNAVLGRLRVLTDLSDPDSDGKFELAVMPGTRSMSIWNLDTGSLVSDTGSLESLLLALDPTLHNIEDGSTANFDLRSDDKGPEPEGLTLGEFNNRTYAFLGLERQNGLLVFDVTDPGTPVFVDYINSLAQGLVSPESLLFVDAAASPTGAALLLVGYELGDGAIGVYSVVPLPAGAWLALLPLTWLARRRIRAPRG